MIWFLKKCFKKEKEIFISQHTDNVYLQCTMCKHIIMVITTSINTYAFSISLYKLYYKYIHISSVVSLKSNF